MITDIRAFESPLRIYFASPKSIFHDENKPHFVAFCTMANVFVTVRFVNNSFTTLYIQLGMSHYQSHEKNHSISQSPPPFQPFGPSWP